MERYRNTIEFEVYGTYALFSDPVMRVGGEKTSYHIPTYEALKGITESIYWKPTIIWIIDAVRVMNPIQTETKGIRPIAYNGGNELAYYTYLKDVRYQVRAHFEMNLNHLELEQDRNENKHHNIAKRMVKRGGRRDIFLGTRECQAFVEPCVFGEDKSYYDTMPGEVGYGFMYHGITYAEEAILEEDKDQMTVRFWRPVMKKGGIIEFTRPEDCTEKRHIRPMERKVFGKEENNFVGLEEFTDEDGIKAAELEGEFATMNGWEAESDAENLLNGLGIETELHYKTMKDLLGPQKVKVLLAQALFGNPDILLLDEPTNHLDLDAIAWLEEFLINFENTVIVVSHDRYFLNKVCTQTADIDYGKIQLYAGNYDFWYESSQLLIKQMKEANKKKEEKIKELQEFISRFSANASKSKQATSRKRALEKIQLDDMRPSSRKYPYIDFRPNREIGNEVLMVENLSKTIDGVKVLDNISFTLGREDKVAFVGANEQAITTFFKIITGEMEPDEGNYKWGITTTQAYFPKDNTKEFDNDLTITDWLTQYSEIKDATYVRGFLGRMLFPGEDGVKRVRVLSGGEKVRCLLSKMMISGANILILDEPTNHLDMESITALNNGLIKFPGVILFTSHDHQFVQTTANRIMEILPNGTMIDKITTYDEYLASDEMAKKRHVFEINEEDAQDN